MVKSDLILLRMQLKLTTCSLEADMNLLVLSLFIEMMICLYKRPLVVMLILDLFELLKIDLLSSMVFLFESSKKFFLILKILLMFLDEIWAYNSLIDSTVFLWMFFPWNFDFSRTFFNSLRESWDRKSFKKLSFLC